MPFDPLGQCPKVYTCSACLNQIALQHVGEWLGKHVTCCPLMTYLDASHSAKRFGRLRLSFDAGASLPHTTIPLLTFLAHQARTWHAQLSQQRVTSQNRHAPARASRCMLSLILHGCMHGWLSQCSLELDSLQK